jgi:hypothetical protein
LLFTFFNKIIKVEKNLEQFNISKTSSRTISSVLYKILYNTGCNAYIDNGVLYEENLNPIKYVNDTLILYKLSLNDKGIKNNTDTIKLYKNLSDNLLMLSKNNKKYNFNLKIKNLKYEFGTRKDDTIYLSNDKWLANGQISKNLNDYEFKNNSKGDIYYNDYFSLPETSMINVVLSTTFKKNFPEGLDTFTCLILNNNDTLAKEYFRPNGSIQNLNFISKPGLKAKIKFYCKAQKGILKIIDVKIIRKNKIVWSNNTQNIRAIKIIYSAINSQGNTIENTEILEFPNYNL